MCYTGRADGATVIQHHAQSFVAQAYRQNLISARVQEERHESLKGESRFEFSCTCDQGGRVAQRRLASGRHTRQCGMSVLD